MLNPEYIPENTFELCELILNIKLKKQNVALVLKLMKC